MTKINVTMDGKKIANAIKHSAPRVTKDVLGRVVPHGAAVVFLDKDNKFNFGIAEFDDSGKLKVMVVDKKGNTKLARVAASKIVRLEGIVSSWGVQMNLLGAELLKLWQRY